jgi:hypothetical protein
MTKARAFYVGFLSVFDVSGEYALNASFARRKKHSKPSLTEVSKDVLMRSGKMNEQEETAKSRNRQK